jgi:hypothetical protein
MITRKNPFERRRKMRVERKERRKKERKKERKKDPPSIRNTPSKIKSPIGVKSIFRNPIRIPQQRRALVLVFNQFHQFVRSDTCLFGEGEAFRKEFDES